MAQKAAMWVHGTIVQVENPVTFERRMGDGAHFRGQPGAYWFHFAITTPVVLDDVRPPLIKVLVFYKANGARITNLHIFDGPRRVKAFDNLSLSGDHSGGIDSSNSWTITPPLGIAFGLGISLGVEFGVDAQEILFTAAGADFQKP
jgi:hypothetical protein